jgi:predicted DNA-binding transcriptional regulator AlpA
MVTAMVREGESKKGIVGTFPQLCSRGLSRTQASAYIGISSTKFDEMVADGRMPRPKHVDKRVIWDRHQLDQSFEALGEDRCEDEIAAAKRRWDEADD